MVFSFLKTLFGVSELTSPSEDLSHGLGTGVHWKGFNEAVDNKSGFPIMVVVHASKCVACDFFRAWFSGSDDIIKLSKHFEMVNLVDDEAKELNRATVFCPYVPRVMFFTPAGHFLTHYLNNCGKNDNLCYYYGDPNALIKTMVDVLHAFPPRPHYEGMKWFFLSLVSHHGAEDRFLNMFKWEKLDNAPTRGDGRPIMAVVHSIDCPACIRFRSWFSTSSEIQHYSKHFVMVNCSDDSEELEKFNFKGTNYVPRVHFLSPSGQHLDKYKNKYSDSELCYHYAEVRSLVEIMKEVLEDFS